LHSVLIAGNRQKRRSLLDVWNGGKPGWKVKNWGKGVRRRQERKYGESTSDSATAGPELTIINHAKMYLQKLKLASTYLGRCGVIRLENMLKLVSLRLETQADKTL
jgi:hypothetical protein